MIGGISMWGVRRLGAPFTPRNISGLIVWLDAGQGITLNGADVSAWADQGPEGNDTVQATEIDQPLFVASWRNAQAAIQGPGFLRAASFAGGELAQPNTIYMIVEWAHGVSGLNFYYDGVGTDRNSFSVNASSGQDAQLFAGEGAVASGTDVGDETPVLVRSVYNTSSSSVRVEPHGASVVEVTGLDPSVQPLNGLTVLADIADTRQQTGLIAELVIYERLLTAAEDANVLAYLRSKYAITAT